MSAQEGDASTELKGGHPPAVKAGGMRVTQNKPPKAGDAEKPVEVEEGEEQEVVLKQDQPQLVVSGFVTKGDKDFPPQAVKSYHEKPLPCHEKRDTHPQQRNIQQPRKQM